MAHIVWNINGKLRKCNFSDMTKDELQDFAREMEGGIGNARHGVIYEIFE